ncbi:MAG: hypothetical protein V4858_16445 [Pseudomonadota bacterium]
MNQRDAKKAPCQQVRMAQSSMGEVCICPDCGVVHVALQYFSMRFEPEAFKTLQSMLCEAQNKIAQQGGVAQNGHEEFTALNADGKAIVH